MIVVINGGSSSGKTSVARCFQYIMGPSWLSFSIDNFVQALSPTMLGNPRGIIISPDGQVSIGEDFRKLEAAWLCGLAKISEAGGNIVLDDVFLEGGVAQQRIAANLRETEVLWVGITCDPGTAERREIARGDRELGMARKQAESVHEGVEYDFVVDIAGHEAYDCAEKIAAYIAGASPITTAQVM